MPARNIDAALLSHPASAVLAAIPSRSFRRVISLATLPSGHHRHDRPRMQRDEHQMHHREYRQQYQTAQMHDARDVVATERRGDPIELHRFVNRKSRHDYDNTEKN